MEYTNPSIFNAYLSKSNYIFSLTRGQGRITELLEVRTILIIIHSNLEEFLVAQNITSLSFWKKTAFLKKLFTNYKVKY